MARKVNGSMCAARQPDDLDIQLLREAEEERAAKKAGTWVDPKEARREALKSQEDAVTAATRAAKE